MLLHLSSGVLIQSWLISAERFRVTPADLDSRTWLSDSAEGQGKSTFLWDAYQWHQKNKSHYLASWTSRRWFLFQQNAKFSKQEKSWHQIFASKSIHFKNRENHYSVTSYFEESTQGRLKCCYCLIKQCTWMFIEKKVFQNTEKYPFIMQCQTFWWITVCHSTLIPLTQTAKCVCIHCVGLIFLLNIAVWEIKKHHQNKIKQEKNKHFNCLQGQLRPHLSSAIPSRFP